MPHIQPLSSKPSPGTLRTRLLFALLPTLALVFTLLIFGPLEIFANNADTLIFRLGEFLPALLLLALGAWLLLLLPTLLLRGKAFQLYLAVVFALALCTYLQAVLLNPDLGALDGRQVNWTAMTGEMWINAVIWAAVLLSAVLLCLFANKVWQGLTRYGSIILVGMQLVSLIGTYATKEFPIITDAYLSSDAQFELSDDENVLVFILDGFDNKAMAQLIDTGPEYLEAMDGFTYYPDTASLYGRTFPAITYLNTAVRCSFTEPNHVYMRDAFAEGSFLPDIKALGYGVQIFAPTHSFAGDASVLEGLVDNLDYAERRVDATGVTARLWQLSGYRYMPLALKPLLWVADNDFSDLVQQNADTFGYFIGSMDDNVYHISDLSFYERLRSEGLRVQSDHKTYTFYHLNGNHPPFDMDENAQPLAEGDHGDEARQSRAEMLVLQEYFNQMKALDIFTYSTIIVTADHGDFYGEVLEAESEKYTTSPIFFLKLSGEDDSEPLRISNVPLSHTDFHPTIMDAIGGDPGRYPEGIPAYAVDEGEERVREYIQTYNDTVATYGIDGPVGDADSWFVMNKFTTDYPFF